MLTEASASSHWLGCVTLRSYSEMLTRSQCLMPGEKEKVTISENCLVNIAADHLVSGFCLFSKGLFAGLRNL